MKKDNGQRDGTLGCLKRRWRILTVGGAICVVAWATFAVSMAIGVGTAAKIGLLSVALVITEALFWVTAAVLGITAIQLRRKLLGKLLHWGRGDEV